MTYKNVPKECLLNNIIDEDFQATYFPLKMFRTLFLVDNFSILDNFITPKNNNTHYLVCTIGAIVWILCFVFRFIYYYKAVAMFGNTVVTLLLYFDQVFYIINVITIHIDSAYQSSNIVKLILKVYNVLKPLKIVKKPFLLRHKIHNWISVFSVIIVYAIFCIFTTGENLRVVDMFINFALTVPTLVFDMDMVTLTRTVEMINNELECWNRLMEKYKKGVIDDDEVTNGSDREMFGAYADIVDAFRLCNKVYKLSLTIFALQTFIHILANLEMIIELGKIEDEAMFFKSVLIRLLTVLWNLKNFMLITKLSIACQNFYWTVNIVKSTCAQILYKDHVARATGLRRTCKNVTRLSNAACHKLSACGVFEVDATLPLRLLAALLAYTVVLLQFAFL